MKKRETDNVNKIDKIILYGILICITIAIIILYIIIRRYIISNSVSSYTDTNNMKPYVVISEEISSVSIE